MSSYLVLIAPAVFAAIVMALGGALRGHINLRALLVTDAVALVLGFFITFTIAWAIASSAALIWLTAAAIGVLVGTAGHLFTRGKAHG